MSYYFTTVQINIAIILGVIALMAIADTITRRK
jgi:hypothetical protein